MACKSHLQTERVVTNMRKENTANISRKSKRLISFTTIPNSLLRNESLSLRARGLLSLMLSYSENWVFYKSHLQKVACLGRDAFDSAWSELIEAKYLKISNLIDQDSAQADIFFMADQDEKTAENPVGQIQPTSWTGEEKENE